MLSSQAQSLGVSYDAAVNKMVKGNKDFSTNERDLSRYITETDVKLGIYTTYVFPKESNVCEAIQINFTDLVAYNVYVSNFAKDFKAVTVDGVKKWYAHSSITDLTIVIIPLSLNENDINLGVVGKLRITNLGSLYDK